MTANRPVRTIALAAALVAAGTLLGTAAAFGLLGILKAILPSFGPEDDDTLREVIPVAMAYLVWGATTAVVILAGWRWFGRWR